MNELKERKETRAISGVTPEVVKQFLFGTKTKLTPEQQILFINLAVRNGLDPFKREIYAISYGNEFNVVTGYQTYIQRATASGLLDGWKVELIKDENGEIAGAKIIIWRKDFSKPFEWEVEMQEFKRNTKTWREMPSFMIKKVAIAQGFRLAFPNELGGLPYTPDELPAESEPIEVIKPASESMSEPQPETHTEAEILPLENGKIEQEIRELAKQAGWFEAKIEAKIKAYSGNLEELKQELLNELNK